MSEERRVKRDWAIAFLGRLCLIAWVCAILYEAFDFLPIVRRTCLLFGPWACVIALMNAVALLFIRRQAVFLFFILITLPPSIHFGLVLKNIAIERQLFESSNSTGEPAPAEVKDSPTEITPNN